MAQASSSVTIDAPRDVVFGVVTDFGSYPEFLDEVGRLVPKALSAKIASASLPSMLQSFRQRAERMSRARGGSP